ncbi:MAG: AmmeMemoRadiSam system radical SAM enzyme [Candidatus Woykebacteria bacterium GWB1_45_5]|uniref:AmmeMemoRadiSam system radical SAM enzyme n=1 Tax=Candidatus Woykebacteria bacterium GWB1_45_5 TaxID=1802592 RepID=A0A1G1W9E7_9BACT|nr:MAG: AmmeMemoRadiSam system radical SAM enzyme [Candidatus Woykebacteria bacterium GWB1_45_5]
MKPALFWEKLPGNAVRCNLCNHFCHIQEGLIGACGVRQNKNGKLYSLNYGKIVTAHIDPVEKKPLYHFLPGTQIFSIATVGCNFRCLFCQNADISQAPKPQQREIFGEDYTPAQVVQKAIDNNCPSIAYTYTEPTIFFEFAYDCAKLANKKGLKNVYVSNGYMSTKALKMIAPYLDAINIDLKSFSPEFYRRISGGQLAPVLENIKLFHKLGILVELTTLIIPRYNDSEKELAQIAEFVASIDTKIPWHLSRFHPMYKMADLPPTPKKTLKRAYETGKKAGLDFVYVWAPPQDDEEFFEVGDTFCPKCGKLAIDRKGWIPNLVSVDERGRCKNCKRGLNLRLS